MQFVCHTSLSSFTDKVRVQLQSGSNALQGRAFYWRTGSLRRICDDGFSSNDARVICRQLGFGSLVTYYSDANNYATQRAFGWSYSRSYWLWRLACDGTELYLHQCRNGGWSPTCYGYEDVGVRCNSKCTSNTGLNFHSNWHSSF